MAIEFDNAILAGVTLVREAIQSQNFVQGVEGWQIAADGTAEFSDLTIRSSDGSSSTVTVANGTITISNGDGVTVVEIDSAGYRLYDATGFLVAQILLENEWGSGGFYTPGGGFPSTFSFLTGGRLIFGPEDSTLADIEASIVYLTSPADAATHYTKLELSSGIKDTALDGQARIELAATRGLTPTVTVDGGSSFEAADLQVNGAVSGANVPEFTLKPSNTDRTNTAALTDDPDLQTVLSANSVYEVEFSLFYGTTTSAGFWTQWLVPSGATGNKGIVGLGSSATSDNNVVYRGGVHNFTTNISYGHRNNSSLYCQATEKGIVRTGASGGTLALQWGQATVSADTTRVAVDSYLKVTKVG